MASISWVLRLLLLIVLTILLAYSTRSQRGTWIGLRRSSNSLPATFSPTTDCEEWLRQTSTSIIYKYGVNDTLSGAVSLRDCLKRDEATQARQKIQELLVAFPRFSEPSEEQQPLKDILDILPNLETVRCDRHYGVCKSLYLQIPEKNNSRSVQFDNSIENRVDLILECGSDSLVYDGGENDMELNQLYHTLVLCSNIRSLSLALRQGNCLIGDTGRSFGWKKGDRFPPLESLTLTGYDWNFRVNSRQPSNAEQWRASMDWSKLKRLDLSRPPNSFLETFRGELDGLDSLTLRHQSGFWGDEETLCAFDATTEELRQNYSSFIASLPPLRELSISGIGRPLNLTPILEIHGATLEKLSIHEFEHDCRYETGNATWVRPVLSVSEIEEIRLSAPNLRELTLDVYRSSNKWPNAILKALSKFPLLTQLTMNFNLEDLNKSRHAERCFVRGWARDDYCIVQELMEPQLNHTTAEEIFHTLRQYQPDTKLQNVTVSAGDFERREGGGLRMSFHDDENKPVRYDCWIQEGIIECARQLHPHFDFKEWYEGVARIRST